MRRDLVDFCGNELKAVTAVAHHVLAEKPGLVETWSSTDHLESGFAEWVLNRVVGGPADERPRAKEIAGFAIRWAMHGLPRVTLSHKRAASLAATKIPPAFCGEVRCPWDLFVVVVPQGLLFNKASSSILVRSVNVEGSPGCRILYQHWTSPEGLARGEKPVGNMVACAEWSEFATPEAIEFPSNGVSDKMGSEGERSLRWHMRLVFGVCLEMHGRKSDVVGIGPADYQVRRCELPTAWNFALTDPVRNDVRDHARDYIRGTGKSLTKQGIVAGHWKNQPCGKACRDRKYIHIEPYWRGKEDAPIAVRDHVL